MRNFSNVCPATRAVRTIGESGTKLALRELDMNPTLFSLRHTPGRSSEYKNACRKVTESVGLNQVLGVARYACDFNAAISRLHDDEDDLKLCCL